MPHEVDTVLNLSLNDENRRGALGTSGDRRLRPTTAIAASSPCILDVVLDFEHSHFEDILDTSAISPAQGHTLDTDFTAEDFEVGPGRQVQGRGRARDRQGLLRRIRTTELWGAIGAVFSSWTNARAATYRKLHDIPESWGISAVNVQAMVFGNMGETRRRPASPSRATPPQVKARSMASF